MAEAPYRHIEAPHRILVDNSVAFMPGDPVPYETAERLELLGEGVEVFEGTDAGSGIAVDADVKSLAPPPGPAGSPPPAGDDTTAGDKAADKPPAPAGSPPADAGQAPGRKPAGPGTTS